MAYDSLRNALGCLARDIASVGQGIKLRRKEMQKRLHSDVERLEQSAAEAKLHKLSLEFERLKEHRQDIEELWRTLRNKSNR